MNTELLTTAKAVPLTERIEWAESIGRMLAGLGESPGRVRAVRGDVRRAWLRRFPYAIHFLAEPAAIVVLAVFHTKRDPRHLENRDRAWPSRLTYDARMPSANSRTSRKNRIGPPRGMRKGFDGVVPLNRGSVGVVKSP